MVEKTVEEVEEVEKRQKRVVGRVVGGEGEGRREKRGRRNPLLNGPQVSLSG